MKGDYQFIVASFFLLCGVTVHAQFTTGMGVDIAFLNTNEAYNYNLLVYNENETTDLYRVDNTLGSTAKGLMVRSFGGQFENPKKFAFGYSLEIGYQHFASRSRLIYRESSTTNADSIVNALDGSAYKLNYHVIRFNHFLDFHWNPSEKIKITNSIGVGLGAIVNVSSNSLGFDGSVVNTNHPVFRLHYQPQITEKYEGFALTYFGSIDIFGKQLFTKAQPYEAPDARIPFSAIRFNAIGIRLVPYFERKKEEILLLE